jgi:hypothetical protein
MTAVLTFDNAGKIRYRVMLLLIARLPQLACRASYMLSSCFHVCKGNLLILLTKKWAAFGSPLNKILNFRLTNKFKRGILRVLE